MPVEIITKADLIEFKSELLNDFKRLFKENGKSQPEKKWLKSYEVKALLGISPGTLQNMRINGTLPFTRIGGVIYYDYEDIQKMLSSKKYNSSNGK